jgi:hypothetical protein
MITFITKYKLIFFLSWIALIVLYPAWTLPIPVYARAQVFFGLVLYFVLSRNLMNHWFEALEFNQPLFAFPEKFLTIIKNNMWLSVLCIVAICLQGYQSMTNPVLMYGDEAIHLNGGLWIYKYLDSRWHHYFQYAVWGLLVMVVWKRKIIKAVITSVYSRCQSDKLYMSLCVLLIGIIFSGYFYLLRDLSHDPGMVRYPPVSRFIYLASYLLMGITSVGPRILQMMLYVSAAIYLYRIIMLFGSREAAVIGASLYLFLPIPFFYAHTAELGSGTVFFITACSYYLLRHIESGDNRDLLISSFLISLGSLYHNLVFLMFFISTAYLVIIKMLPKGRNVISVNTFKVMLISLVPVIPWMIIRRFFTWRNYDIIWPHLWLPERYWEFLSLINTNLSLVLFSLFLISAAAAMRDSNREIWIYFGLLFVGYFLFLVADWVPQSARLSMVFYPPIAVFLSVFFSKAVQNIKWRNASKLIYGAFIIYLMAISMLPPLNESFYLEEKSKVERYPSEQAVRWIDETLKDGERILTLRMLPIEFYRVKFGIDKEKIVDLVYGLDDISTPDALKAFCARNKISYIMFPYSTKPPKFIIKRVIVEEILTYLKENKHNDIIPAASFSIGENFIYVYKLNNEILI